MSNTTTKFKSGVEWLAKPSHAIVVGVLLILVIAAIWFATKKIKSAVASWREKQSIPTINEANLTPTLNFPELARRLWDATVEYRSTSGIWSILTANIPWGTSEEEVYSVLGALRTQDDYSKLKEAWRNLYDQKSGFSIWFSEAKSSLPGELTDELSESELARCRAILEQNGITPDF